MCLENKKAGIGFKKAGREQKPPDSNSKKRAREVLCKNVLSTAHGSGDVECKKALSTACH